MVVLSAVRGEPQIVGEDLELADVEGNREETGKLSPPQSVNALRISLIVIDSDWTMCSRLFLGA